MTKLANTRRSEPSKHSLQVGCDDDRAIGQGPSAILTLKWVQWRQCSRERECPDWLKKGRKTETRFL